jgi:Arc/MetJ family transcription regulator
MAITSMDIDRDLLSQARELLGAGSNREAVQRALEFTVTMERQRIALDRIARRRFSDEQIDAPPIDYSGS